MRSVDHYRTSSSEQSGQSAFEMAGSSFFTRYSTFSPEPEEGVLEEFERLALHKHWIPDSNVYIKKRMTCLSMEASACFTGMGRTTLQKLQRLCREVGIQSVPNSVTACRKGSSAFAPGQVQRD